MARDKTRQVLLLSAGVLFLIGSIAGVGAVPDADDMTTIVPHHTPVVTTTMRTTTRTTMMRTMQVAHPHTRTQITTE